MKVRTTLALQLLLLIPLPVVAQDDPCASSLTRSLDFGTFTENLSATVSDEFNAGTKTEIANRANGDGITSNRLDLLKKAFLALDLGQVDQKDGDLVFNFNPDTLNSNLGQFSPRIIVHKTALFMPLETKIDTLPESVRQSRKDTLTKGIGDLDDVEVHVRWTQASGTPRAALQTAASEIFTPVAATTGKPAQELASEIANAGEFFRTQLSKPLGQITIGDICKVDATKKRLGELNKLFKGKGTAALTSLQKALNDTLFFKLGDLIDGQPRLSADGSFRRRSNATGPNERSFELRFEMGATSYWALKRFAAGRPIEPELIEQYFKNKSDSAPSFSATVNYTKTSDFRILLPVDETVFRQAESRKLTATATGGLYFGGGRSHRLELKANYDDITDDPTRQNRFVGTLSWVEKLNSTLTQALGGSDLTVTFIYANKPEFRGEVQHAFGLRAGLKWSVGGTSTK